MGLKKAAVARLCLNGDIYRAMPEVCDEYLPHPAPLPVPTGYAQAEASVEQPYTGGDIWLVEGTTGKDRLCHDYDVTQQRCRVWAEAYAVGLTTMKTHTVHHSAPKKKKAMGTGETSHTAASPAVAETIPHQTTFKERWAPAIEHPLPSAPAAPFGGWKGRPAGTVFATTTM